MLRPAPPQGPIQILSLTQIYPVPFKLSVGNLLARAVDIARESCKIYILHANDVTSTVNFTHSFIIHGTGGKHV